MAGRVGSAAEAISRGETGSGAAALTPVQWVRRHAPSTRSGGSAQIVAVAKVFSVPGREAVKDAVLSGELPVSSAAVVASEADKLAPLLADVVEATVPGDAGAKGVTRGLNFHKIGMKAQDTCEL